MRCYAFFKTISLDDLVLTERPDPVPGPRDIVLRMRAAALNFRDLAIVRGHYHVGVSPPLVPVSDGAGEVIQIGSEVTRFRIGDLVCPTYLPEWIDGPIRPWNVRRRLGGPSDGVLSELMCLHEDEAVCAPRHLDAAEAAQLPVAAATAWHSLFQLGSVRPGETVLIQGSGGISTIALQLAHAAGARTIMVTRNDRHADTLRTLGADDVLGNGAAESWPNDVLNLTDQRGAEISVNVAGGNTLTRSIAATRMGGLVHLVGYAAGIIADLDIFTAIRHATTIHVATAGNRENLEDFVRAAERHKIRPVIAKAFRAEQIRDAFAFLARGGHLGKVGLILDF
ncbi:NAD(P)-dependent alcohol dehydrogenase [Bradyrhizobium sp. ARR65]|uniref:zinc-dependent alcohol dehydrogenase family protein n=1 Tax=Bradyrhizobium sp. ARR65 TaxID=1040989 RepID=UPI0004664016|nr:NAD(P)-dependent alcohol dehydrogenase [Bradyrhizobium sp. ARR65]